jgi:DNA-binding response OmpR family regulator
MRVLVVEDEEFLSEMVAEGLRRDALAVDVAADGLAVDVAADGLIALRKLALGEYDVLVLGGVG